MNTLEGSLSSDRSRIVAVAIVACLVLTTAFVAPFATIALPEMPTLFTIFLTLAWSADVLTSFLFVIQGRSGRAVPLLILGSGYVFSSLVIALHALTFPGVFAPKGLLGADAQSAIWFWVVWHGGFPLFVVAYAIAQRREVKNARTEVLSRRAVLAFATIVVGIVAMIAIFILKADRFLPVLIHKGHFGLLITTGVGPLVVASLVAAIVCLAALTRLRRITDVWLAVALVASLADISLTLVGSGRYTLGWDVARLESLIASTVVLLTFLRGIDSVLRKLAVLSRLDGLTGLVNRRSFDESLIDAVTIGARADRPLSLVMIDVDFFKRYNDTYGHQAGDETLRIVADCIGRSLTRRSDIAARYGGEEFVLILPATDLVGATKVAERVRAVVERCGLEHRASPHGLVTVSLGVHTLSGVQLRDKGSAGRAIAGADEALYRAKETGRNRLIANDLAAGPPPPGSKTPLVRV